MKITYWGAIDDVTGSMTFIDSGDGIVMVDCGLSQGLPEIEKLNYRKLPYEANRIKAVILTHAHLDHSGYLPALVKQGFRGEIYCTQATLELTRIILNDSATLMKDDGLYNEKDATAAFHRMQVLREFKETLIHGLKVTLRPAGHILGATSVSLLQDGRNIVFSGDLGRDDDPLIPPPSACVDADIVVMESTYGGKIRSGNIHQELSDLLRKVREDSRVMIVASFAVARGQNLLTLFQEHFRRYPNERVPLIMDSPMMEEVNHIYRRFSDLTLEPDNLVFAINEVQSILSVKMWEGVKKKEGPLVILASSGMVTGGRIWRHLENWKDDHKAILFLPGYQSLGTPGHELQHGHRTIHSENGKLTWKGEVIHSDAFSSHADKTELLKWMSGVKKSAGIRLIHGEPEAKRQLKSSLEKLGYEDVVIPEKLFTDQL